MLQDIAELNARMEGFYIKGSVSQRLNNPGNLIFVGQPHALPYKIGNHTYCCFRDVEQGWEALRNQIRLDASRGLTLLEFVKKFAPGSDGNNPEHYAAFIASGLGAQVTDKLSTLV